MLAAAVSLSPGRFLTIAMGDLERIKPGSKAVAEKPDANPEGKGLNGFLLDWYQTEPKGVVEKPPRQVLAEMFTSMLVLSAKFKFRPSVGTKNYLYWINGEWSLSLIAPNEWSEARRRGFAGMCILQRDMTWTIEPSDLLRGENPVSEALGRFYDAFAEKLDTDMTLEEILPFYAGELHYYPRLFASALSRSIRTTLILTDRRELPCRQYQSLPGNWRKVLLENKD